MPINSRQKGARGERQFAQWLRENFNCPNAKRGQQYCGLAGNADVIEGFPNTHAEVKFVQALNVSKAMTQAIRDCKPGCIPYVAHKKNREEMLITVQAKDLEAFAKAVISVSGSYDN
jgi:hypothetical protein